MSVSIIVPCYNVAPYVEACLDSLVNQSLRNIEIICVNDGSTDVTPALLDAWAEKEDRIRVIHRETEGRRWRGTSEWIWPEVNTWVLWIRTTMWNLPCLPAWWRKPAGMALM